MKIIWLIQWALLNALLDAGVATPLRVTRWLAMRLYLFTGECLMGLLRFQMWIGDENDEYRT